MPNTEAVYIEAKELVKAGGLAAFQELEKPKHKKLRQNLEEKITEELSPHQEQIGGVARELIRNHSQIKKGVKKAVDSLKSKDARAQAEFERKEEAKEDLICEIIIDACFFFISVIGVKFKVPNAVVKQTAKAIRPLYKYSDQIKFAVDALIRAYAKGYLDEIATALWGLCKAAYDVGIFGTIFEVMYAHIYWYDYVVGAASVVAIFATGGAAFIIKLSLNINSAVNLTSKIIKLINEDY